MITFTVAAPRKEETVMYDPSIGRWLEEDPLGFEAGDANLYRYVGNGPTNKIDPYGLWEAIAFNVSFIDNVSMNYGFELAIKDIPKRIPLGSISVTSNYTDTGIKRNGQVISETRTLGPRKLKPVSNYGVVDEDQLKKPDNSWDYFMRTATIDVKWPGGIIHYHYVYSYSRSIVFAPVGAVVGGAGTAGAVGAPVAPPVIFERLSSNDIYYFKGGFKTLLDVP